MGYSVRVIRNSSKALTTSPRPVPPRRASPPARQPHPTLQVPPSLQTPPPRYPTPLPQTPSARQGADPPQTPPPPQDPPHDIPRPLQTPLSRYPSPVPLDPAGANVLAKMLSRKAVNAFVEHTRIIHRENYRRLFESGEMEPLMEQLAVPELDRCFIFQTHELLHIPVETLRTWRKSPKKNATFRPYSKLANYPRRALTEKQERASRRSPPLRQQEKSCRFGSEDFRHSERSGRIRI